MKVLEYSLKTQSINNDFAIIMRKFNLKLQYIRFNDIFEIVIQNRGNLYVATVFS